METQVTAEHYSLQYDGKTRGYSYIEQIMETCALGPRQVVEVGIGNGFCTRGLRGYGIEVTTVDYSADLHPDIVASVLDMPLPDACCDAALCFEVLEHLPFENFVPALNELARISREWVYVSVPDIRSVLRLELVRGWSKPRAWQKLLSNFPPRPPRPHVFDGQHYWEIGKAETPESAVVAQIGASNLHLVRHYRLPLNPYHHFFLCKK